ncbi:outer membrane beta-barrel family protein [Mucilaginibacter glaciei]|uniref:TonB-dependent receptor n=1 Tax=Mucilaginibacter glaciei TaxID=2772109 RepID=A0A926S1S8_9SPHI|nr:outer membrane beta-barrel family protein [Mucilaginibacter glaciei]MBD1393132.1 TonB-dependent receptor [Mucilaginibacter glaciei]
MRVKSGCYLIAFIACFYSFSYAQTKPPVIRGYVFLQNKTAAEAATVILLNQQDSSVVSSALVNVAGAFILQNIKPGNYLVLVTRLGYQRALSENFQLTAGRDITVPRMILMPANTELKAVSIFAKTPFVETRPGKIIINPQASITADGKSALEILRQSPGVKVDNNDNVSISGKQAALILIDGKTTNLSTSDLATLLRSTQGSTIERIELIRAGSARYDAAAGGIINIIIKKGKNTGTNGTYTATAGYGRYYKANTGILFNSRNSNVNIFGNYNLESRKSFRDIYTDRNITSIGGLSNYNSTYTNTQQYLSHTFKVGADYYISPNHIIGVVVNGAVTNVDFAKDNTLKITNNGNLDSVIKASSTIARALNNINYNLNYSGKLNNKGDNISANLTYTPVNRHNDEYIANNFFNSAGSSYRNPLLLQNLSPSNRNNWTALLDYAKSMSKTGKLEAGLKYSTTHSNNDFVFGPKVGNTYVSDPNFSNQYIYTEKVSAGYLNYRNSFGRYDLETGIRGEYTSSLGNSIINNEVTSRKYFNLFPSVLLNYRANEKNQFNIGFSRGILRPEYEKLNPFFQFLDLYSYQAGNPYLKPSYTNAISIGHIYDEKISTSIYADFNTDQILPYYIQNNTNKIAVLTNVNLGTSNVFGLTLNIPVRFFNWWNSSYSINASYQHYKSYPLYGNLNQQTGDMVATTTQNFMLNKFLSADIFGSYETANAYGVNQFKPQYFINAGLKARLPGNRSSLSLNVSDIFNTYRDRYATHFQGLDLTQTDKSESRIFRLSFSYRFGKNTVKDAPSRKTGNEAEQNRMRRGI